MWCAEKCAPLPGSDVRLLPTTSATRATRAMGASTTPSTRTSSASSRPARRGPAHSLHPAAPLPSLSWSTRSASWTARSSSIRTARPSTARAVDGLAVLILDDRAVHEAERVLQLREGRGAAGCRLCAGPRLAGLEEAEDVLVEGVVEAPIALVARVAEVVGSRRTSLPGRGAHFSAHHMLGWGSDPPPAP